MSPYPSEVIVGKLVLEKKPKVKVGVVLEPKITHVDGENIITMERVGIIEGYQDDITCIPLSRDGNASCYLIGGNIVKHYPRHKISLKHNPRKFQRRGKVTKAIEKTLLSKNGNFRDKSHPMHWIVRSVTRSAGKIRIEVTGILDGGHRHLVITENLLKNLVKSQHEFWAFIYMNYPLNRLHEMANGLNLSSALKDQTIMYYNGKYSMFQKAWPDLFKNGHDGVFKITENQKNWKHDADDFVMLLVTANRKIRNTLTAFACSRGENKIWFNEHNGMFQRLFPSNTLSGLGLCVDYAQMYVAEVLEQYSPDLVKKSNAKTKHLYFIDRDIEKACRDKHYFLAVVASLMDTQLDMIGKGDKARYVWKKKFIKNIESNIRKSVYLHGKKMAKIISTCKDFPKNSPAWIEILNLFKEAK